MTLQGTYGYTVGSFSLLSLTTINKKNYEDIVIPSTQGADGIEQALCERLVQEDVPLSQRGVRRHPPRTLQAPRRMHDALSSQVDSRSTHNQGGQVI